MSPRSVFITGCNRGIGLELVGQFLRASNPPEHLFATCREPSKATELMSLAANHPNLRVIKLDLTDYAAFAKVAQEVRQVVKGDGLNLLINNAGMMLERPGEDTTLELMKQGFEVNCIAPYFLTRELVPLIKTAATKNGSLPLGIDRGAIVMISTGVASIGNNDRGGMTSYRCSKAALNMAMKNLSIELKGDSILVVAMHPGWVQTRLGGPGASMTTEACCSAMIGTFAALRGEDNGQFKRFDNGAMPW